ncbi:MAG: tellurite resistance TerB family protein [Bacteroidia bacterium]
MDSLQNLHYAIGLLAYAVAFSDGKVQKEEREKFHAIVEAELRCKDYDFNVSDIIFQMMEKEKSDAVTSYNWAMKEIKTNSHYLSPELKKTAISVMEKIAKAFPPITKEENRFLEMFKKDIAPINGDPVYYHASK